MRRVKSLWTLWILLSMCGHGALAQAWEEPQDTSTALNRPDEYAWRLFVALSWPADPARREADPDKKFGEAGMAVWESWKNSNDVFLANGADPKPWLEQPESLIRDFQDFDPMPLQQLVREQMATGDLGLQPAFDPNDPQGNEVRMNKATFDFIATNGLYHLGGQEQFFYDGKRIDFPLAAKEVKAQWRPIREADKPKYHWAAVRRDGQTEVWGLTAIHITTKDLPNWFWATFEHVDNPNLAEAEPWLLPSHDRFGCTQPPFDCNQAPAEVAGVRLTGTKWENYRLRGTQIDFVDSTGKPTVLANSQIEQGFQLSSSCITCHATATIGPRLVDPQLNPRQVAQRLHFFVLSSRGDIEGRVGSPPPSLFDLRRLGLPNLPGERPSRIFSQTDFVWSLFRARRKPAP